MKKIFFMFTLIGAISMVSCKKDRVCECTIGGTTFKITLTDASKRQAKDACISRTMDDGSGLGTMVKQECELKK